MFRRSTYGGVRGIITRIIAVLLCICMLLTMGTSFFSVLAEETDDGATSDSFTELEASEDDPLLDMDGLSATTIALLQQEMTLSNEEPINEPPEQDPVTGDGTTIEKITIRWLSSSTGETAPAGYGRLNLAPDGKKLANQQFQIDFSLSGQTAYEPGDIEIIFPAYLWLDRDNNQPGELTLSVPEDPETGVDFVWKRIGDNIVITNAKKLPAASKVLIQGTFREVEAWKMKDETLSSDFTDFNATIVVTTSEGNELTMTSNSIDAYIDTSVHVTGASKTAYDSNSKKYNIYWESVPSAIPSEFFDNLEGDAEDYVYIRWYISGTASGSQPFEMTVTDTVEDKYDGVMLGATSTLYGNVKSPDGKTVTATLYDGYTENYRTAFIWTAYPKDQFEEGEEVQFQNTQTITVTGWDDGISTTKSASATVDTWDPIHYKFVKIWDDNDNEMGVRPDFLELDIYDTAYSYSTPSEQVFLTEEDADEEDSSHWVYEWTDEGQPGHNYTVDEKLYNYEGDHESRFDEEGHKLHWIYTLASKTYDPDSHTWEYVNKYDDGWIKFEISRMEKQVEQKYRNNELEATTDSALNDLLRGKPTEIKYPVWASLSAAKPAVGYGATPNTFVLEDGTYRLNDIAYPVEDMNIGAVIMKTPNVVWKYTTYDQATGYYYREVLPNQTITLYGYVNDSWVAMATMVTGATVDDEVKLTVVEGSGAKVTGMRVDLPDNTARVKTEITSGDATIVEMSYTVCLRLNPTAAMKSMVQGFLDKNDFLMFPVFNKADGYVVYEGNSDVNVEGTVYHPGDHLFDITDMATGYVHGRRYKVAAELTKTFKATSNDNVNRAVVLHSTLTMTQQSNLTVFSEYTAAIENGDIPNTQSGYFYDLLPFGVSPDLTTIKATSGGTVAFSYIIEDYKNSGRTLLVVKVDNTDYITYSTRSNHENYKTYPAKGYKNSHTIEFDSLVPWDIIQEYGVEYMRNVAAYEADEDWVGSVSGWEGEPDNPTAGNHILSGNAVGNAAEYMTGLHDNRTDPSFVYAGTGLDHDEIDVLATTSLWKYVQVNGTGLWANGQRNNINVEEGGRYVYQLSMKSAEDTNTQDIIIIDSLENYVPTKEDKADYGDTQWHGNLVSIDTSPLEEAGIKPIIYYSTVKNLDVSRTAMDGGKDEESVLNHLKTDRIDGKLVWSTTAPANMGDVTAIAIDARKTVSGEDFILEPGKSLTAYLHMKAPFEEDNDSPFYFKDTDGMNFLLNAHAYNDVHLDCLQNVEGRNTRDYITHAYTKVGIYTKYINISKVWDDGDDADGFRPDSLTVHLLANGEDTGDSLILNDGNNWKGTFKRIHTYDEEGNRIIYSYSEDDFEHSDKYRFTFNQTETKDGHTEVVLTNQHTPEQIDIPVTKIWADDNNNALGTRPEYVIVRLYADGVFTGRTLTLRADSEGNWSGTFTGLNKNRNGGEEIIYTVEEEYVDNYLSEVDGFTITNTYHPMGDLIISKTVENTTTASENADFTFDLQLSNADGSPDVNKYDYIIYDKNGEVSSGRIGDGDEFTLKGGQYIVISDIPTHVLYTVTETPADGFTQTAVSGDSGEIRSGDNKAAFTNTYSSNGSLILEASKVLTGRDLLSRQFKFELTDQDGNVISANNSLDGSVTFSPIKYTEADHGQEYTYTIKEVDGGLEGYGYDGTVYIVKVRVTDNGKGSMIYEKEYFKSTGEAVDSIVFNNTYEASGKLPLRLWKTIDREMRENEFTFDLFDDKFVLQKTASNDDTGAVVFDDLEFNETHIGNTYLYFAREQMGSVSDVKYSNTVLGYLVTVKDNGNGTLSFDSQAYDLTSYFGICEDCKGFGCNACSGFGYLPKVEIGDIELGNPVTPIIHNGLKDGSLSVMKHVSSATGKLPDEEFRFKIVLIGDEVPDGEFTYTVSQEEEVEFTEPEETEKTGNAVTAFFNNIWASIQNVTGSMVYTVEDAAIPLAVGDEEIRNGEWVNGEFEFTLHGGQKATFSDIPAGTIYQVLEETVNGWVKVSQSNVSGVIAPTVESQAEFSNRYQPGIATAVLMGVKYLDGKPTNADGKNNIFEFVLLDEDGKVIEYVDAQPGGFITFSTLKFEEKGTYKYTIREVSGFNSDIHYDDHEESVTIKVTEDSNGNLSAEVKYDKDRIVFENKTMPGALEITKNAEGLTDANKDAEFKFRVKFFNPGGVPIDDNSFTWYVKDNETNDTLEEHKAELQIVGGSQFSKKIASIYNKDIMPIAGEHTKLLNSSSTGVVGTVRWSLYDDGALVFEPVNGNDGILEIAGASETSSNIPWRNYSSYINSIESIGNIHVVGDAPNLFSELTNLVDASGLKDWDMSQAKSLYNMFHFCHSLSDISFMANWDTSSATNMSYLLQSTAITNADALANFDFSNAKTIAGMFASCSGLTDITALSGWEFPSSIGLGSLFNGCSRLENISPLANWDVSNVTSISSLFSGCSSLTDISSLAKWNVTDIPYMYGLFEYCSSLKDISVLSRWNPQNIISAGSMFNGCASLEDTLPLMQWNMSQVTDLSSMFKGCSSLTNVNGLLKWDVSNVTSMRYMFDGCTSLSDISGLARWNVANVSLGNNYGMDSMFTNCISLTGIDDLSEWRFGEQPVNMQYMFQNTGIVNVNAILEWNAKASNVVSMFQNCKKLSDITGLAGLDVSNCTSLQNMFCGCSALETLNGLEDWNVSNCASLERTFRESGVSDLTPLKEWDVSKVNTFTYTFAVCKSLKTLDGLENWNVTGHYLNSMFEQSNEIVDASAIGSWTLQGSRSATLYYFLYGCKNLEILDFSNLNTSGVSDFRGLWNSDKVSKITFGENFWNGVTMNTAQKTLTVHPATPPTDTTTGYWVNEDEYNSSSNPRQYTSAELVSEKVVGTYIWQYLPPYTIKFDGNGGDGSMSDVECYRHLACELKLEDNKFTKPGYIFTGWRDEVKRKSYNADENGIITIPKNTYSPGETVTLKAIWVPLDNDGRVSYTIEYYQQSADDPEQYDLVDTVVRKAEPGDSVYVDPEREDFEGFITPDVETWYDIPESNGYLTVKLYYDRTRYKIHFDGNGAEYGSMADIDMVGNVAVEIPESSFGIAAGVFLGWNADPYGVGDWYYPGQFVKNLIGDGETITLYAQWMIIDQSVDSSAGEIIVSCKAGQTIVIQGLPAGITYEIEEIEAPNGWYFKEGTDLSGTIISNGTAYSSVTNEYIAKGQAQIIAHKDLQGATLTSEQFAFTLKEPMTDVYKTASFDNEGNFIEPTASTSGGTPFYLPNDTDVHFNVKYVSYYFAPTLVYLYGENSGNYIWQGTYDGKTETIAEGEAEFDWHYTETSSDSPAGVLVNVYGYNSPQQRYLTSQYYAVLTYDRIVDTATNGPIDMNEQTTDKNGKVVNNSYRGTAPVIFDAIEYTKPGEYTYYISEVNGGDSSIDYDGNTRTVRVIVTDNGDGTLSTEVIYDTEKNDEPVFTNYMNPGDLVVSKTLSNGTDVTKNVNFSFQLFLKDLNGIDLTGTYTVKKSDGTETEISNGDIVTIKADESFTVCNLPHGCQYEVVELSKNGFTLADSQGNKGEIEGGETSYATFNNVYSAKGQLELKVTKNFIGGTISPEQFAFELVDQNGEHIETVYADENGNVVFSPIDFTEADVGSHFVYHIFETSKNDDHIIYDNHTADIAVTVIDKADGTIDFEMDYDKSELVFTNVSLFDLEVSKTVAGNMGNKADTFTFNMTLSNEEYELENSVEYEKGDESGTLSLTDGHYEFTLAHDETIRFIGLPVGTKYDIVETGAEKYATSISVTANDSSRNEKGKEITDTLNANTSVSYVNSIDSSVPTDATMVYGWVAALAIVSLAIFFIIAKRKRRA